MLIKFKVLALDPNRQRTCVNPKVLPPNLVIVVASDFFPGLLFLHSAPAWPPARPAVFLELSLLRNEAIGDAENLFFCDGIARHGCVVHALVLHCVEALEGIVNITGLLNFLFVVREVRGQYPGVVAI